MKTLIILWIVLATFVWLYAFTHDDFTYEEKKTEPSRTHRTTTSKEQMMMNGAVGTTSVPTR